MNKIDEIKKNLKKRKKKINIEDEVSKLDKKSNLYRFLMMVMSIYLVFVSFAVYAKKDENAVVLNSLFNTNINFRDFNSKINDLLDLRIINGSNFNESEVVSGDISYIYLGDDFYMSEGDLVTSLDDGVVSYVNGKDDNYTVIIEYDNGVRATYYNLVEVNVFSNDRVYVNDIIGSYREKVKIIFIKNNVKLEYEDIFVSWKNWNRY